ncbi:undecaprenyl-diphosphatase [Marivivens niveibacter]|uniref:Undecaprenyl-diphosphatase n=1 Tax=Marivivens niveibacter TaxID=1930667 RepID=A0A251WZY3_9RHOB|nr:undecaprenyl-diphosphate phosphatase [Marivivens niveibacter]OUD09624.1 undecaprenyl-diphosphatase [Marivivens niveibacter]
MTLFYLLLVALIQGLTEFLPVSSSGHLALLPHVVGAQDQGVAIDVAVHVGTLGAVILFFWADVKSAIFGVPDLIKGRINTPGARLAFLLVVATIPVVIIGLVLKVTGLADQMRSVAVIGWAMLIFGIVLYVADQKGPETQKAEDWNLRDAIIMGLWQAVALIPGTSRSGITITGARALGYTREDGAKIAMLMSIPTIMASGILLGADVVGQADWELLKSAGIGALFAFFAALGSLALMMRLLKSVSFTPYVIYRIILGIILIAVSW